MNEKTQKCKYCKLPKPISQFIKVLCYRKKCCESCYQLPFLKKQREKDQKAIRRRTEYQNFYENNIRRPLPLNGVLCSCAKQRAKRFNLPFNLKPSDIIIPKRCPVLGIELKKADIKMNDFSPTLDRIDPLKGYTKDNICVISNRANRIKSDGTIEEHEKIISYMREHDDA
jgi:hypothetical protein